MARLQILQLPEGASDDRAPFLLVIDQYQPLRYMLGVGQEPQTVDEFAGVAEQIGARGVLVFQETVDIPANEPVPLTELTVQGGNQTAELIAAHEQTRQALCDAFLLPLDSTWAQIIDTAGERQRELAGLLRRLDKPDAELMEAVQRSLDITPGYGPTDLAAWLRTACRELDKSEASRAHLRRERDALKAALERVRNEPDEPEIMNAQEEHPTAWKHGYGCGVRAAKRAARPRNEAVVTAPDLTKQDVRDAVRQELDRAARLGQRGMR